MAESVVKLRVDSQEYDSKIKRAADGLRAFGENCQKAGESVAKADKETLDYVRAIGQMETVSKNAKGKVNEMTAAFTELSVQYKNLTDEEKKSPFGQALAQSLDQLKTRINDSKAQLSEVNAELSNTSAQGNQTGGVMAALASKFTMNIDVIKLLNVGLSATKMALDVAKDAFFASEANVDEWGRIVESSRSLYEGFLYSINNGDISGFLGRIGQIVDAARAAYNELDRLGTMRTIQAPQISAQQAENDRMRQMIQTGRWISAPGKSSGSMKDGQILTPAQIKLLEDKLKNGMTTIVTLVGNEVKQTGNAIEAVYRRQGVDLGMSVQEFKKGTSSMAEFDKRMAGYDAYLKWDAEAKAKFARQGGRGFVDFDKSNPYAQYRRWGTFRVDGERYNDLVRLIQQRDQQTSSMYNMQGQAYRTINRAEGITTRSIMGGGGGGRVHTTSSTGGGHTTTTQAPPPAGSIAEQEAKVQALTKAWREATDEVGRAGYAGQLEEAKKVLDEMQGKTAVPAGSLKDLKGQMQELQKERELLNDPISLAVNEEEIARVQEKIDSLTGKTKEPVSQSVSSIRDQVLASLVESRQSADAEALRNLLKVTIENGLDGIDIDSEHLEAAIFGKYGDAINIPDEYWEELTKEINAQLASLGIDPIKIDVKTGEVTKAVKEVEDGWDDASRAVQAVGNALQQIEDPSAKIAGIVGEAIANIALGFAQATAKSTGGGIFGWIAAIAGGLGTMLGTISAIKSATAGSYAEGGIVPGNNYNDGLIANVSSGELILNRAQQNNIANQLEGGIGSLQLDASIRGEDIILAITRTNKRMGRGEYAYSKSR